MRIVIAGAGSLGSMIAMMIARPQHEFLICDDDRVEDDNVLTSAYYRHHVGSLKAHVLAEMVYRKAGCEAEVFTRTLDYQGKRRLAWGDLIVDTFDNTAARRLTLLDRLGWRWPDVVHVGVGEQHTGAVIWDEHYQLPPAVPRGENPVCTHELGIAILRFTSAVAAGVIDHYITTGEKRNLFVTEGLQVTEALF